MTMPRQTGLLSRKTWEKYLILPKAHRGFWRFVFICESRILFPSDSKVQKSCWRIIDFDKKLHRLRQRYAEAEALHEAFRVSTEKRSRTRVSKVILCKETDNLTDCKEAKYKFT